MTCSPLICLCGRKRDDSELEVMMALKVIRTSVFPASAETVFARLKELPTLQKVAYPWASFMPLKVEQQREWHAGEDYDFRFRVFCLIPFGIHHIHVVRFGIKEGIYTQEHNDHVPVWNHEIRLRPTDEHHCVYTDHVEIDAGWKTPLIWIWAKLFYARRQRRWIQLLNKGKIR